MVRQITKATKKEGIKMRCLSESGLCGLVKLFKKITYLTLEGCQFMTKYSSVCIVGYKLFTFKVFKNLKNTEQQHAN